jgi:FtsZ-interacting cell division protein ZipA
MMVESMTCDVIVGERTWDVITAIAGMSSDKTKSIHVLNVIKHRNSQLTGKLTQKIIQKPGFF